MEVDGPNMCVEQDTLTKLKGEEEKDRDAAIPQNPVAVFLSFVFFSTGLFSFEQRADSVKGQWEGC